MNARSTVQGLPVTQMAYNFRVILLNYKVVAI